MQVEQHINRVDQRSDFARAVEFDRTSLAVQHGRIPNAIDILIDEARCGWLLWIEPLICGDIGETECQFAARRRKTLSQQSVEHDGARDLIAVPNAKDCHVRTRLAGGAWGEA